MAQNLCPKYGVGVFLIYVTVNIYARMQGTSQDTERGTDNGKGSEKR